MVDEVLDMVHHVLIMSVNPGFGAQKFIPGSLNKIKSLVEVRESLGLREGGFGILMARGLVDELAYNKAGNEVTLEVVRGEDIVILRVTLGKRPG